LEWIHFNVGKLAASDERDDPAHGLEKHKEESMIAAKEWQFGVQILIVQRLRWWILVHLNKAKLIMVAGFRSLMFPPSQVYPMGSIPGPRRVS
jgi:hypothetical protein